MKYCLTCAKEIENNKNFVILLVLQNLIINKEENFLKSKNIVNIAKKKLMKKENFVI